MSYQNLDGKVRVRAGLSTTYSVLAIAIASATSMSALAASAKKEQTTAMETVVVTGSVIGNSEIEDVKEYPGARTVITRDQIEKTAAGSIDNALQRVPGIKVQDESGTGVLPNISVRGLKASRSGHAQFLMDGVPLTLAPYGHTGQSIFPATLSMLDRIDIVRGGAAVQYGPNNVGGVINLVTKPIPHTWQTEISNRLTVFDGGDAPLNDFYLRTGGWLSDTFALQLEGNFLKGESFREHSDTDVKNFQAKAQWLLSDTQEIQAFLQRYDAETQMPGALSPQDYEQDRHQSKRPYDDYEGKSTRWSVKYIHDLPFADSAELEVLTFGHKSERLFKWGFNSAGGHWADPALPSTKVSTSPREFRVYGIEPRLAVFVDGGAITQNWIIGTRYINEDIQYKVTQTPVSGGATNVPRNWHLDTDAYAGYVSNEIGLFNGALKVTPGLRYEFVDMSYKDLGSGQESGNKATELLPGVTIAYNWNEQWLSYANAQKSLRVPQLVNVRGVGEESSELAWNYELGVRYVQDLTSFNAALYRIDFKDQLQWQSGINTSENIGRTLHQGIELSARYVPEALPALSLGASYNYLDATLEEAGKNKGNQLPYTSKHQLGWDATYAFYGMDTTLSGFYFSDSYTDNANTSAEDAIGETGKVPSYMVWNFNLGTDLYKDDKGKLRMNVAVNNLFDEEYYFRGIDTSPVGRYPAPGRSYTLDLNYQF
ncbi:TonB-dependent siderophore receptor [Vibrio sp. RM-44-3]|uniref:TonB-dependent receptor family protein n=1 Tax=unclassified Vibrio TaxID=2614977 RepID=UPI00215D322A|nr:MULTISPECIES: TonB-dependent siderophore receptor [unclassified Vibrio]MCR9552670.1 TonB-dependent siderophore receptor [Vibrio sp. RM-41-2A]MCR9554941.1 TonB-dependent siderophore receptor [Vibrio sp. RM-41-2B]MCR9621955.1 TonB-dependent siderophore receptor [Vibrio sp. RM-44-3]